MTKRTTFSLAAVVALAISVLAGAVFADDYNIYDGEWTTFDAIAEKNRYSTLEAALLATGLDAALKDESANLTLFAPSDAAFETTLGELGLTVDDLVADPDLLTQILLYHVVDGEAFIGDFFPDGATLTSLQGDDIVGNVINFSRVELNDGIRITRSNLDTFNGVYHEINEVLLPPSLFDVEIPEPPFNPYDGEWTTFDAIFEANRFSTLQTALELTDLDEVLKDESASLTLFAPTNAAFERTLAELGLTLDDVVADLDLLETILLYHVVPGEVLIGDFFPNGADLTTVQGEDISGIIRNYETVIINGDTRIQQANLDTFNGVYHVINEVLLPPSIFGFDGTVYDEVAQRDTFTILTAALEAVDLDAVLDDGTTDYTLLAPTDAAFERTLGALGLTVGDLLADPDLLTTILLYHVIAGEAREDVVRTLDAAPTVQGEDVHIAVRNGRIFLNETIRVTRTDIPATNGVIHQISEVLLPPSIFGYNDTLADFVAGRENFSTLATALELTGLDVALDQKPTEDGLTLLAPTNAAFERTLAELGLTLDDLVADPALLEAILLYHVVPVAADEATVRTLTEAPTLNGATIAVDGMEDHMPIILNETVRVTRTDIETSNGIIHVLNSVLIPPADEDGGEEGEEGEDDGEAGEAE